VTPAAGTATAGTFAQAQDGRQVVGYHREQLIDIPAIEPEVTYIGLIDGEKLHEPPERRPPSRSRSR